MIYKCTYFGQWSSCDHELTCPYGKACYHAEEEYNDHIAALIERDQPGEPEEYKKENYEGSDDQL